MNCGGLKIVARYDTHVFTDGLSCSSRHMGVVQCNVNGVS